MAKRKSRKRASSIPKSSWVDKIFSVKKIFALSLIITVAAFVSYNSYQAQQVAGISTTAEGEVYTKSDLQKLAAVNPSAIKFDKYVAVELWADSNKNAQMDGSEQCIAKNFTFKLNGKVKTKTQPSDCSQLFVKVTKNCNTLTFVKTNTSNKYNFTGIEYHDSNSYYKSTKDKSVTVCGFPKAIGDDWGGFIYNEVSFGVKGQ